jgi:hypothetical protein
MPFGLPVATPRVTTGNVRTTWDPYTPSPLAATPGATTSPFNGLACPLGTTFMDVGGGDSVSGTTTQLPLGQTAVYKYVLYKSATNPALTTCPGCVYYTDTTGLIVSGTPTDGVVGKITTASSSDIAGIMMLNTTDQSAITATLLNNSSNGSGIWICVGGFCKATDCNSSTAAGDVIYGIQNSAGTAFISANLTGHTGTLTPDRVLGYALTSAAQIGSTGVYTCDLNVLIDPATY